MKTLVDSLDNAIVYTQYDTVVVGIQHPSARAIALHGLSRHNQVFDAYREPTRLLPTLLDIPCFIRLLDVSVYAMLEEQIVAEYCDPTNANLPPLIVFGEGSLHCHPLIYQITNENAKSSWSVYRQYRRRAKRASKRELI